MDWNRKTVLRWLILLLIGVSLIAGYFETLVIGAWQRRSISEVSYLTTTPIIPWTNRTLWFVHIGKAGGETIKEVLKVGCLSRRHPRRKQACLDQLPRSRLSDVVFGYSHCFLNQAPLFNESPHPNGRQQRRRPRRTIASATSLLVNARHPVDRVLSWYYMVHPGACQPAVSNRTTHCATNRTIYHQPDSWIARFFGCFPTADDWVRVIDTGMPASCAQLSAEAIAGGLDLSTNPLAAHMIANYRGNLARLPVRELLVVRTESLWTDLAGIDRLLGGTGDFGRTDHAVTHGSERNALRTTLPPAAATGFCCALADEMLVYAAIITRAANLHGTEKRATIQAAAQRCNLQDWDAFTRRCGLETTITEASDLFFQSDR